MVLTAKEIKKIYNTIKYKATDGEVYFLKEIYPICMGVKDSEYSVFLDTGGQMIDCDFFEAKIQDNKLFRKKDVNNDWNKIADLILEN